MPSPLQPVCENAWADIPFDTEIDIAKLAPDGREVTRYPGRVIASPDPVWLVAEAMWTRPEMEIEGLRFVRGDRLIESFSHQFPFNAFCVIDPNAAVRGWYANVTWPSWIDLEGKPVLYWHDLYIDLIGRPSGDFTIMDEDELADASVDPVVRAMIDEARDELVRRFRLREMPFRIWWE
ncbi:MAG: DUF402 domain-containing protein [Thermomicrobiales bacterium]